MPNLDRDRIMVCGHRGAAAVAPENTLAGLEAAVAAGADMVEVDVRLTRDGAPVLFHDRRLGRTAPGAGPLGERDLADLRALDAGSWFAPEFAGRRIPLLAEYLDAAPPGLRLNLELKADGETPERGRRLAEAVVTEIAGRDAAGRIVLTSFDHALIDAVAAGRPDLACGRIYSSTPPDPDERLGPGRVLSIRHDLLQADWSARAAGAGRLIMAWTVNDPQDLERVVQAGADVVITDDPARVKRMSAGIRRRRG